METMTYDQVRERLAPLEGYGRRQLSPATHPSFEAVEGGGIDLAFPVDPTDGDTDRERIMVTRELWAAIADDLGAGSRYFNRTPPRLLLPQINYWYGNSEGGREVDVLVKRQEGGDRLVGLDVLKSGRHPISATQLLDVIHGSVRDMGTEPTYPLFSRRGLRECTLSICQPQVRHEVTRSRQVGDILEGGVMVNWSPIGARPVTIQTYVNRLICTNGMSMTSTVDAWAGPGGEGSNDPYEWIPGAIRAAIESSEGMFRTADRMADAEVPEDAIGTVIDDMFAHFRLPSWARSLVVDQLAEQNVENVWDIQNAVTYVATHSAALGDDMRRRTRLMNFAGDMPGHSERCPECSHLIG